MHRIRNGPIRFCWKNSGTNLEFRITSDMFDQLKSIQMKKVFSLALIAIAFASCTKTYTCECTVKTTGTDPISGAAINSTSTTSGTIEDKKKDAEDKCAEGSSTQTTLGITSSITCEIK
jgi:hypothetical protein